MTDHDSGDGDQGTSVWVDRGTLFVVLSPVVTGEGGVEVESDSDRSGHCSPDAERAQTVVKCHRKISSVLRRSSVTK